MSFYHCNNKTQPMEILKEIKEHNVHKLKDAHHHINPRVRMLWGESSIPPFFKA